MTKEELTLLVDALKTETHEALQTIWNNVNKGQKKQIRKIEECEKLLERYEVSD